MKKILFVLSIHFLFTLTTVAQVAVSTDGSAAGANTMLDIKSNNKGVKFPRLTTAQRKAIPVTTADAGLMVFDTDKQVLFMYDGEDWLHFAATANSLALLKKKMPATSPNGNFGGRVAISGLYAVVAAAYDTVGISGAAAGSAYIFKNVDGNWVQQSRITAPDARTDDQFAFDVAIDGDYVVVGALKAANLSNVNSGAIYVYKRNGDNWEFNVKLTASDGGLNYYFGQALAIQGSTILVGARSTKVGNNTGQGAAYIYTRTGENWSQSAKLMAPDGVTDSYFGGSVALHNNTIVIGASNSLLNGIRTGAAYTFNKTGNSWVFHMRLNSVSPVLGGGFGASVTVDADCLVVGAPAEMLGGKKSGTFHLFKKNNNVWVHAYPEIPLTLEDGTIFGSDVDLKNDILMVTSPYENIGNAVQQGSVYVYKKNQSKGFDVFKRINDPEGLAYDGFGFSVGFDGSSFVIGLPNKQRNAGKPATGLVFFGSVD